MTRAEQERNALLAVVTIEELPQKQEAVAAILEWRDSQIYLEAKTAREV